MELSNFLNALRDPAGVPFYPLVFQFLMVLTFTLHIMAVNVVVGGLGLAVWESWTGTENGRRLAAALARAATIMLSIAIVLGVAPLLFVQVIYDPFWYASNTMSAFWALSFLVAVCGAFYSAYGFYLGNKGKRVGKVNLFWAYVAIVSAVAAGFIIHMLSMESLMPQMWRGWLVRNGGSLFMTGGAAFHGVSIGRLLHFIMASFAVTGVFLLMYAWYFRPRSDYSEEYLEYVAGRGSALAIGGTVLTAAAGFWWTGTVPAGMHFTGNHLFIVSVVLAVLLAIYLARSPKVLVDKAPHALFLTVATVFFMSYAREALRMEYLGAFDYSIFDYKVNVDWGSTALFFVTFVLGLVVLYFPAVVAFKSGRAEPGTVVTFPASLGRVANLILVLWFVVVAALGLFISIKNGTLF